MVDEAVARQFRPIAVLTPRATFLFEQGTGDGDKLAIPLLEEVAGGHVEGIVGDTDPFVAVRDALKRLGFDEIIVSTLPARVSHWLRRDLPSRVGQLGLPVTVVTATQSARTLTTTS